MQSIERANGDLKNELLGPAERIGRNRDDSDWAIIGSVFSIHREARRHFAFAYATIGLRSHQQTCELNVCQHTDDHRIRSIKDDIADPTPVGLIS